jgi:hypothetical protein
MIEWNNYGPGKGLFGNDGELRPVDGLKPVRIREGGGGS